jgi:hypothetical protein
LYIPGKHKNLLTIEQFEAKPNLLQKFLGFVFFSILMCSSAYIYILLSVGDLSYPYLTFFLLWFILACAFGAGY